MHKYTYISYHDFLQQRSMMGSRECQGLSDSKECQMVVPAKYMRLPEYDDRQSSFSTPKQQVLDRTQPIKDVDRHGGPNTAETCGHLLCKVMGTNLVFWRSGKSIWKI